MDIVDTRADFVRDTGISEGLEKLHLRPRRLDRDHVGIHSRDRLDDLVELRVAHVRVDLRLVADTR